MQSNALMEKVLTSQVIDILSKLIKLHCTVKTWTLNSFAFDSLK